MTFLSSVRNFDIGTLSPDNDGDPVQWLGLFHVFSSVEKLHVTWGSVLNIARALQLVSAEIAVNVLPALRELKFDWFASRWREAVTSFVMTPPMVGSTWPRVRSTLGSDCLPTLSQGTASLHLFMDLLIVIFVFGARMCDVRCPVILGLY